MTSDLNAAVRAWLAHDPDPNAAAELSACSSEELAERFAGTLTFGTAGLRGPMRAGPNGMNLAVVLRATWALGSVLTRRGHGGGQVIVGYDARHRSADFARGAAEVLAAQGFSVTVMFAAVPTPAVAFTVRHTGAAAGCRSPRPTTRHPTTATRSTSPAVFRSSPRRRRDRRRHRRRPAGRRDPRHPVTPSGTEYVQRYLERASSVRRAAGTVRVALTPMHGVGGEYALDALALAGFSDVHVVDAQFAPDPDFPPSPSPTPRNPGRPTR